MREHDQQPLGGAVAARLVLRTGFGEYPVDLSLREVTLRDADVGAAGARLLAAALAAGAAVTSLDLPGNRIGAEGVEALAAALPASAVAKLDLLDNAIGDAGAERLAAHLPRSRCAWLSLSRNLLTNRGAEALAAALPACARLATLSLRHNRIEAEGAAALAGALPSSAVACFDIGANRIGDEGAIAFAGALEPPAEDAAVQLRQLSVGGNVIGAETAKALQRAAEAARCVVQVYARDHARVMVKKR